MTKHTRTKTFTAAATLVALCATGAWALAAPERAAGDTGQPAADKVARGAYLVKAGGCNDCHTPLKMGARGPEPDMTRMLSGHPEAMVVPPPPRLPPGPWLVVGAATMTAWSGPWGVSFTANLTPDKETGLGAWTTRTFVDTIRSGRHMGRGRPILPPMPVQWISNYSDEDLAAIFAYLQTVPPVKNHVPQPIPPAQPVSASR
jgi:cytochrome c553